jgi:hypothetical protein
MDLHLLHPHHLLIHKPSIQLTLGFTAAFIDGCWLCRPASDLALLEVEPGWMTWLKVGGGARQHGM